VTGKPQTLLKISLGIEQVCGLSFSPRMISFVQAAAPRDSDTA
jgi:hypothetical protein